MQRLTHYQQSIYIASCVPHEFQVHDGWRRQGCRPDYPLHSDRHSREQQSLTSTQTTFVRNPLSHRSTSLRVCPRTPRLSCCVSYLQQQQQLVPVCSTSVWLPRSQAHTTAFSFSLAQRAALHPLALLHSSNACCCVTVSPVSVMACRVASLQVFGVRSPPSPYVPSISMILVSMFDSHCQLCSLRKSRCRQVIL